jgi:hypothetical protein
MNDMIAIAIIGALIALLNGIALFWIHEVKCDLRDLRNNYVNAIDQVSDLKVEIASLKGVITLLQLEITTLKEKMTKQA